MGIFGSKPVMDLTSGLGELAFLCLQRYFITVFSGNIGEMHFL